MKVFNGKIKEGLDKTQVIDLINLIVETKPDLPDYVDNTSISKLFDIEKTYESEDGLYDISLYFRESDEYIDKEGNKTYGDFKYLYRVTISKRGEFIFSDIKEYILLFKTIMPDFYDVILIFKIDGERVNIDEVDDNTIIEELKIILRVKNEIKKHP